MALIKLVRIITMGYVLGSIPSGFLVARRMARVDVRQFGSGSTGTNSVLNVVGRKAAAYVFTLDLLKGAVAVLLAGFISGKAPLVIGSLHWNTQTIKVAAALSAMAGHRWSVFLWFRGGGRGVVTYFGGLAALYPPAAIFGGEVFLISVALTKFASLSSVLAAASTCALLVPLTLINKFPIQYLVYACAGTLVIIVAHRENLKRITLARRLRKR